MPMHLHEAARWAMPTPHSVIKQSWKTRNSSMKQAWNGTNQNKNKPPGPPLQHKLVNRDTTWTGSRGHLRVRGRVGNVGFRSATAVWVWRNRKLIRTLVSSWAFARLSTAIAKNTFRSVSFGEQLRKTPSHSRYSKLFPCCCHYPSFPTYSHQYITHWPLTPLLCLHL